MDRKVQKTHNPISASSLSEDNSDPSAKRLMKEAKKKRLQEMKGELDSDDSDEILEKKDESSSEDDERV